MSKVKHIMQEPLTTEVLSFPRNRLNLATVKPVLVNIHHVKKSKELDDNNPTKNDRKDPKVIAVLIKEGRYMIPYLSDGIYVDLRTAPNMRFQIQSELTRILKCFI